MPAVLAGGGPTGATMVAGRLGGAVEGRWGLGTRGAGARWVLAAAASAPMVLSSPRRKLLPPASRGFGGVGLSFAKPFDATSGWVTRGAIPPLGDALGEKNVETVWVAFVGS